MRVEITIALSVLASVSGRADTETLKHVNHVCHYLIYSMDEGPVYVEESWDSLANSLAASALTSFLGKPSLDATSPSSPSLDPNRSLLAILGKQGGATR